MKKSNQHVLGSQTGFTLLEIMLVLSIIGVIAYALFGDLFANADNANIKTTKTQIETLKQKIKLYKLDNAKYPESWDDLVEGNLIEELPVDAWGNELMLEVPGSHGGKFDIWSTGPDEESDTEDDVVSWSQNSQDE